MDHLVLQHPSYMRGFTYPFSLSVITVVNFLGFQAAFRTTFRVKGGYLKAGTSFLKRVTGKDFYNW